MRMKRVNRWLSPQVLIDKLHEEADGRILVLTLVGELESKDFTHFTPEVERAVKKHRKTRSLVEMQNFHGWTMGAMWEDIKFDAHQYLNIERLALVGDKKWRHGWRRFASRSPPRRCGTLM